jgi:hypothetical protein
MKAIHENNFWETNPELTILPEFSKVFDSDKSKGKQLSSTIMWGIYYAYNPESKFFSLPNKLDLLEKNFIKQDGFSWGKVEKVVEIYKGMVLSDSERALVEWGEIMTMRSIAMKKLYKELLEDQNALDIDTKALKEVDTMLTNTPKMFEDYKKVRKDYEEEKTTKKGKKNLSLSDSREL